MKVKLPLIICLTLLYCTAVSQPSVYVMRDPTKPFDYVNQTPDIEEKTNTGSGLTLSSIMVSKKRRLAIVNGKLLSEGDKIQNAEIVAIHHEYIVLSIDNKTFILHLFQNMTDASSGKSQ